MFRESQLRNHTLRQKIGGASLSIRKIIDFFIPSGPKIKKKEKRWSFKNNF
jgi:hypothetical protein